MSSHSNESLEQVYYEGDQSKLYSGLMNHHTNINSAESKAQVKRIWVVTGILTFITILEVTVGLLAHGVEGTSKTWVNIFFLIMTIVKAAYIVSVFMHLGDEKKNFRMAVLTPLILFIWWIIAFLYDGNFWMEINDLFLGK